jgi:prophage regulatory protein
MPEREKFYSAADLAARYQVHLITIFKWLKAGKLPEPVRLGGGTTRWRPSDITKHEAARRGVRHG